MKTSKIDPKEGRPHPGLLVVFCIGLVVAGRAIFAPSGTSESDATADSAASTEVLVDDVSRASADEVAWTDLLAAHGSYVAGTSVRVAFSVLHDATTGAAPGGETKVEPGAWQGEDPPLLQLGVVMVSAESRRAVLGGQVVGVGDQVATAQVTAIEVGAVTVQWQGRRLTYDLDDAGPREFRAELLRRSTAKRDETKPDAGTDTSVRGQQQEERQ